MELYKSLEKRTKSFEDPFKHFEISQPLTSEAIKEISEAEVADPKKENLKRRNKDLKKKNEDLKRKKTKL